MGGPMSIRTFDGWMTKDKSDLGKCGDQIWGNADRHFCTILTACQWKKTYLSRTYEGTLVLVYVLLINFITKQHHIVLVTEVQYFLKICFTEALACRVSWVYDHHSPYLLHHWNMIRRDKNHRCIYINTNKLRLRSAYGDSLRTSLSNWLTKVTNIKPPVCGLLKIIRNERSTEQRYCSGVQWILWHRDEYLRIKQIMLVTTENIVNTAMKRQPRSSRSIPHHVHRVW